MLWLYLLGAVTVLVIAVRRLRGRLVPMDDELYSKRVALDHIESGVAWVRADGEIGWVNVALAATLGMSPEKILRRPWMEIFGAVQREYSQMLLQGKAHFEMAGQVRVTLVAIHDHNMRFVGHHCLVEDRRRERELENRIQQLTSAAEEAARVPKVKISRWESLAKAGR